MELPSSLFSERRLDFRAHLLVFVLASAHFMVNWGQATDSASTDASSGQARKKE